MLIPHLEKLPYFVAIAEHGSFRRASDRLRLSQPSLSRAIAVLEEACGAALFVRQKTGVVLTGDGERLLAIAKQVLKTAESFAAAGATREKARRFTVVTHELLVPWLAPSLAALAAEDVLVRIDTAPSVRALLDRLEDGKADAAIVASSPLRKSLRFEALFADHYGFVCAPALRRRYTGVPLRDLPLIYAPEVLAGAGETLAEHLARRNVEVAPRHVAGSLESVAALAAAGLGVGLLPVRLGRILQGDKLEALGVKVPGGGALGAHGFNFACGKAAWRRDRVLQNLLNRVKESV